MKEQVTENLEGINEAYKTRVDGLASADEGKNEEAEKAREESGIESVDTPLDEQQRFVANPEDLRKTVTSEEEFSEGLTDGDDDLESTTNGDDAVIDGPKLPELVDEEADEVDNSGRIDQPPTPNQSWTKERIVDYIIESDVDDELERDELAKMTKAELLDRFIDSEG